MWNSIAYMNGLYKYGLFLIGWIKEDSPELNEIKIIKG